MKMKMKCYLACFSVTFGQSEVVMTLHWDSRVWCWPAVACDDKDKLS